MIDGIRRYITFVSHGSSGPETNWSVPIISRTTDTLSCLKTDNQNLITMNTEKNPKVYQWKLAIQDYDCTIGYIEDLRI